MQIISQMQLLPQYLILGIVYNADTTKMPKAR